MRGAGAGRSRDHVAGAKRDFLAPRTASLANGRRPELECPLPVEDEEHLFLLGVAVRHRAALPRLEHLPVQTRLRGALACGKRRGGHRSTLLELDLVDVEDVVGPRLRSTVLERPALGLRLPRVVVPSRDPRPADANRARPWQLADLRRMPRPEDEVLETLGPGNEGVLVLVGPVDDAVARAHLVHVLVLPREAGAGDDVVELLRRAVRVRGRRQHPRADTDAIDAAPDRARRVAEALPARGHCALRAAMPLDVVPVRDSHRPMLPASRRGCGTSEQPPAEPRSSPKV